jgi:hypothetical protein
LSKIDVAIRERVKAHAYDRVTSSIAFAEALTKGLQAISHDKHMRVFYCAEPVPKDPPPEAVPPSAADKARFHTIAQRIHAGSPRSSASTATSATSGSTASCRPRNAGRVPRRQCHASPTPTR